MTILQHEAPVPRLVDGILLACGAKRLHSRRSGHLTVSAGRVWVTRSGDLDDHVLGVGQTLAIRAHEEVVVEPWQQGSPVRIAWRSDQSRALAPRAFAALAAAGRRLSALGLRAVAALRGVVAERLPALARNAAASDRRAHGCIARGDSSASSGAVQ